MTRLRSEEGGWALVTAIVLMTLMMGTGLSTFAYVDTQQGESRKERTRETAFNYAEAALNAQIFSLSREWPGVGASANQYPACNQAVSNTRCPAATTLAALFPSVDAETGTTYATRIRDNNAPGAPNFYSDALVATAPAYDANGDGKLWVRAEAQARGKKRTLIALVNAEEVNEVVPRAVLIAGRLNITNNGNKTMINAGDGGLVAVRCNPTTPPSEPCLGHPKGSSDFSKIDEQISPYAPVVDYSMDRSIGLDAVQRLRATAKANGTYYATCPGNYAGRVVFVESGNCTIGSNTAINSPANPGMLVLGSGLLSFSGTADYYGVVYHANLTNQSTPCFDTGGNAAIIGGLITEGNCVVNIGSSKQNLVYDENAFNNIKTFGTAGIIQNTWREIKST
jgi:Tfp pilus assembly protein PilX